MQKLKLDKRIAEEIDGILKMASLLPSGKANALRNKCAKIRNYAQKGQALIEAPVGNLFPVPTTAGYDARDNEDIANTADQRKKMWTALIAGRVISIENADEMGHTRAFASRISEIRTKTKEADCPWVLCDAWVYPGGGRSKYKKYWLIPKE